MNRKEELSKLSAIAEFDCLIIGGGATGLGCAVDAASRGLKTLLVEKYDFAKGTSSRATKLVHGGVRYLEQGNIRLVTEALQERGRLLQNAPHVCHILSFIVPSYTWWQKWYYGMGLWIYEFLSDKLSLGSTKFLSKKETLQHLPNLAAENLTGGVLYFDGRFDDSRLAINLAQTAIEQGAVVVNYVSVTGFIKADGKIKGVKLLDEESGDTWIIAAKVVINATGVFADDVLQMAEGHTKKTITPSQGVHIVVEKDFFKGVVALMIPKTDDGRVLFAIPWYDKLLLGTTDTAVKEISVEPTPLKEEVDFIIHHFNRYATTEINYRDVKTVFAGLRPLAKQKVQHKTAVMPRDHVIAILPSGLVHVTGGKWTTYRSIGQHAIDKALQNAGMMPLPCKTKNLKIHGWVNTKTTGLFSVYGADAEKIEKMLEMETDLAKKIHPSYTYTKAEVKWCIENEMAITVEDVLARRLRLLFIDAQAAIEAAPVVVEMLAAYHAKNDAWQTQHLKEFITLAKKYVVSF